MAESYNTNLPHVAISYLKELHIPVNVTTLKKQLNENPWFPSLYSLSSTFDRFHIPHQAFKLDAENIDNLTPPYIAYLKNRTTGKDFVLVKSVSDNEVHFIAE
ncbi:MAG: cysteine peptidase family C39 domain-containing protein, partial [Ginsengibacter sp.]